MLTLVANHEDSQTISIPAEELQKLGFKDGDEVELLMENGEIHLRSKTEAERKRKFEDAKNKVFAEWNNVFIELAKGADDPAKTEQSSRKFDLFRTTDGKYQFRLIAANGQIVFDSKIYKSKQDAVNAINLIKKTMRETQGKISDFPVEGMLEIA